MSIAVTPKSLSWQAIPARKIESGSPRGGGGTAARQRRLDLVGHGRGHFVIAAADGRAQQRRDVFGLARRAPASPPPCAPPPRAGRRPGRRAPPRPPRRAHRPSTPERSRRSPPPGRVAPCAVTNASVSSTAVSRAPSTTSTRSPWTWFIHTTRPARRPRAAASRARFSATAAGSSPTWSPRLKVSKGGFETPPARVVVTRRMRTLT